MQEDFPLIWGRVSHFVLFWSSADWKKPTHIRENNQLYSVYQLNFKLIPNCPHRNTQNSCPNSWASGLPFKLTKLTITTWTCWDFSVNYFFPFNRLEIIHLKAFLLLFCFVLFSISVFFLFLGLCSLYSSWFFFFCCSYLPWLFFCIPPNNLVYYRTHVF